MFLHNFKYSLISCLRDKEQILWSLVFIIALGTLFFITFGDIYNQDEKLADIKVAVCIEDEDVAEGFDIYIRDVSLLDNGAALLDIVYEGNYEEADKLLKDEEIKGIFYSEGGELKLAIAKEDIQQSILSSLVIRFHQVQTLMTRVATEKPDMVNATMLALFSAGFENEDINNSKSDMDVYVQYFYNLIAMACIMSASVGVTVTVRNQSTSSILGSRKEISGVNHFVSGFAGLLAGAAVQAACVVISFFYLVLIGVKFGSDYGKICLIIAVSIFTGTSIGYCIGSIPKLSIKSKDAISSMVSVLGSFLSGLMLNNMRIIVEKSCPIINKINPVALVCDSFYAINTFETNDRLYRNLISLMVIAVVCIFIGTFVGRRKDYACV